ncbi:M61 family metallopeptidase [Endothiovibrio diazotrophicus]
MTDPVLYRITPIDPAAHLFEVECHIAEPDPAGQVVSLPAWIPGSYMIRDFARNLVTFSAQSGGKRVDEEKIDKQTWRVAPCVGPLELRYTVYAWDLSVRAAHLDESHGYFNGTSVFLRVHGRDESPCAVEIRPPVGIDGWRVATTLAEDGAERWGFGRYRADDYDELVDHPVEMGTFDVGSFEAGGVVHEMVFTGRHYADIERICADLQPICEGHIAMFGELPPMERYLFQVMVVGDGYGGLEHRSSTSLVCSRDDLPQPGEEGISEGYRTFLGLCSHEYFHTWNVKRIKPAAFLPYDLAREVHTRQLWAFEGITSYYDDWSLTRYGSLPAEQYLELLGQTITRVTRGPGQFRQTLEASSFDAWTKFYKQDENAPNAIVSYYTKGAMAALALDLTLRLEGDTTLGAVMVELWRRHGKPGIGVPEGGVEAVAGELSGLDLGAFFDRALRSTEALPLAELLAEFGVALRMRANEGEGDKGGKPAKRERPAPHLGARTAADPLGSKLTMVFEGAPAHRAGLSSGDVVIALDGLRCGGDLEKRLARMPLGGEVELHAFRRDELRVARLSLEPSPADTAWLELIEDLDEATRALRQAWLGV